MRIAAIVVAAGEGSRFGGRKQFAELSGATVAARSVAACRAVAQRVVLVAPPDALGDAHGADEVVAGGPTRSSSVREGLAAIDGADVVVVHDAARPLASAELFRAVVAALDPGRGVVGAVPGAPLGDTLKRLGETGLVAETLDRERIVAAQTPQAFEAAALLAAHASGADATDDAALVELAGGRVAVVPGEPRNRKLTTREDLEAARHELEGPSALRIGQGYDVHRFADDARPLVLCGVQVAGAPGLEGHSDADVGCHALCDAVLGAAGLGDLGRHFPDDDPTFAGIDSMDLLARTLVLAAGRSLCVVSGDVTVIAARPRLTHLLEGMSTRLSAATGAPVNVKATSPEGLGAIGRGEGIAASAVVLLGAVR